MAFTRVLKTAGEPREIWTRSGKKESSSGTLSPHWRLYTSSSKSAAIWENFWYLIV